MLIDMYAKSTFKSRMTVLASLCLITAAASYSWLVQPHVSNLRAAENFIRGSDSFVKKAKTIASLTQLKKIQVDRLASELDGQQKHFFSPESLQAFFTNLESVAAQTQCTITSIKLLENEDETPQANGTGSGLDQCRAALSVRGNYKYIIKFMNELMHQEKQITISRLTISARQDNNQVDCSMAIGMYVINTKGADVNES